MDQGTAAILHRPHHRHNAPARCRAPQAQQGRIESFFKPAANQPPRPPKKEEPKKGDGKRKAEPAKAKGGPAAKKGKLGGVGGGKKK